MPPKKRKLVAGQLTLFGTAANTDEDMNSTPRRWGDVDSWREFAKPSYAEKYPWMEVHSDGIYYLYCALCQDKQVHPHKILRETKRYMTLKLL